MSTGLFLSILIPATIANIFVSRRSLFSPRSHGFYRFFAFELILILLLMNAPAWFDDPFSTVHLLSWALLIGSIVPALGGYLTLRQRGNPAAGARLETNLAFENTGRLITTGMYRHIRHPMYASLLMLAWGTFLKDPGMLGLGLAVLASGVLVVTARVEETENVERFGEEYEEYVKSTPMFFPRPW